MRKKICIIAAAFAAFFTLPIFGLTAFAAEPEDMTETQIVAEDTFELPALPPGTGTVIDYNTDPDGRLFYTIMTPDEHVFYLVIDKNSSPNNVYFLNAVTLADLAALAEIPLPTQSGTVTLPPSATGEPELPPEMPPMVEEPQSNSMGMYIIIGLIVVAGGGAGWYFKIYRPKQERMASGDEYEPSVNEQENDYAADWGDGSDETDDLPQIDGESGDVE